MKIQIRPRGITLTRTECVRLHRDLDVVLARFGERIDRVTVEISDKASDGYRCCDIEVRLKPQILRVEHTDKDVFLAMEHASLHIARSVKRAIETEVLVRR